jgi:phosphoribosylformylglycinamidine (FGAM) synthase-like amidotransferase family enzyme
MKPQALILQAHGTNRDYDVAEALSLAGADPHPTPLNDLRAGKNISPIINCSSSQAAFHMQIHSEQGNYSHSI